MKESLIHALENVARNIGVGTEGTAIDTLQAIMTEAKEKVTTPLASARYTGIFGEENSPHALVVFAAEE